MKLTLEQRVELLEQGDMERRKPHKLSESQIMELFPEGYSITKECMNAVSLEADLPVKSMRWSGRTQYLAHWRQVAMHLAFRLSGLSSQNVATLFNRTDHSTILHARKVVTKWAKRKANYQVLQELRRRVVNCTKDA